MRLYMPTKVFFGSGCVSENGAELKALGSRAMIVTGKHSSRINGSLAAVEQALQANGQTYVIFDEIEENPSVETVAVAAGIAVKEQVDFLKKRDIRSEHLILMSWKSLLDTIRFHILSQMMMY